MREHKFKTTFKGKGPDETTTSYRFRQRDPDDFVRMRTIKLDEGVSAVVGPLKRGKGGEKTTKAEAETVVDVLDLID